MYRNIVLVLIRGGITLAPSVVILSSMVLYVTQTLPTADAASKTAAAVAVALSLLGAWLAVRIVGSRITAGPDGLFVHRVLRRCQYVPWQDVTGFKLIPAARLNNGFTRSAVAVAVLRDCQRPLYCLGASFSEPSPAANNMLDALRSEHQTWLADQSRGGLERQSHL